MLSALKYFMVIERLHASNGNHHVVLVLLGPKKEEARSLEEDARKKNMARKPARQTLQRAPSTRCVKAQHDLSTTKFTSHKHLLQMKRRGYAGTRYV